VEEFEVIEEFVRKWESEPVSARRAEQQWVIDVVRSLETIENHGLMGFWSHHGRDSERIFQSLRLTGNPELARDIGASAFCRSPDGTPLPTPLSPQNRDRLNRLLFSVTDRIEEAREGLVALLPRVEADREGESDAESAEPTLNVEVTERVGCPYCGQFMELVMDTSIAQQRSTTDCEVCCRPFEVVVECEPGRVLSLDVGA
jgi:Cysteine-rich CPXCG